VSLASFTAPLYVTGVNQDANLVWVNTPPVNNGDPAAGEKLGVVPAGAHALVSFTSAVYVRLVFPLALKKVVRSVIEYPVGEEVEAPYFKGVTLPARILFSKARLPLVIFLSVGVPLVASTNKPTGKPVKTELNTEIEEFLLICKPFWNNELIEPTLVLVLEELIGPIIVIFENVAEL